MNDKAMLKSKFEAASSCWTSVETRIENLSPVCDPELGDEFLDKILLIGSNKKGGNEVGQTWYTTFFKSVS